MTELVTELPLISSPKFSCYKITFTDLSNFSEKQPLKNSTGYPNLLIVHHKAFPGVEVQVAVIRIPVL